MLGFSGVQLSCYKVFGSKFSNKVVLMLTTRIMNVPAWSELSYYSPTCLKLLTYAQNIHQLRS